MNDDEFYDMVSRITQAILRDAATWEVEFPDGAGEVVSVSDAAYVVARMLNAPLPAFAAGGIVGKESFDELHTVLRDQSCPSEVFVPISRKRRLKACVEEWPYCETGEYNPACCRFPKSCSADVYDPEYVTEADLEDNPS